MATVPNPNANPTPLIDRLNRSRNQVSAGLLVAAALFAALAAYLGYRAFNPPAPAATAAEEKPPTEPGGAKSKTQGVSKDWLAACVWAGALALVFVASGFALRARPGAPGREQSTTRVWLLATGGAAGLLTAFLGLVLLWQWQESLERWVREGQRREARWVLLALATFLAGLLVMFVSVQPARAEERSNAVLRRVLYGYNSVLAAVLVLLVLAVGNVVAFARLPNRLDTTAGGLYSLNERSREFLADLRSPVKAYLIMPTNLEPIYSDIRTLLTNCEEASPNFKAVYLAPGVDRREIAEVQDRLKLPATERNQLGLALAVGPNEEQTAFLPLRDLITVEGEQEVLQAESKLIAELSFLAEGKEAPVVYFTQGNGELNPFSPDPQHPDQGASILNRYLKERKFETKPVNFTDPNPPSLEGAAAVAILGPTKPFPPAAEKALRAYLFPQKEGQKPGKLLAFLGPFPASDETKVGDTGLEGVLGELGVQLEKSVLVSYGAQQPYFQVDLVADPQVEATRQPLSAVVTGKIFQSLFVRQVSAAESPGSNYSGRTLLVTDPDVPVWHEPNYYGANIPRTFKEMMASPELKQEKRAGKQSAPTAVLVSERGGRARAVVVGTSVCMTDLFLQQRNINTRKYLDLTTGCLDWLREKPGNIGISPRPYGRYQLEKNANDTRLLWLPLGLVCLAVLGMGAGVWVVRRR